MPKVFLTLGALFALTAVGAGAFGTHALRERLSSEMLSVYEVAVRYQMYHALGLLVVGLFLERSDSSPATFAGWLLVAGIVIFSGTLYVLSLTGVRWLGAVTPVGGLAFLAGWAFLLWGIWAARAPGV